MSEDYNPTRLDPKFLDMHVNRASKELEKALLGLSARKQVLHECEDALKFLEAESLLNYAGKAWKGKPPAKYILDALIEADSRVVACKEKIRLAARRVRDAEAVVEALRAKKSLLPGEQGRRNLLMNAEIDDSRHNR